MLFVSAGGTRAAAKVVDIGGIAGALHVSLSKFELGSASCYDPNEVSARCGHSAFGIWFSTLSLSRWSLAVVVVFVSQERRLRAAITAAPGGVPEFDRVIRALSATQHTGSAG